MVTWKFGSTSSTGMEMLFLNSNKPRIVKASRVWLLIFSAHFLLSNAVALAL